MRKRSLTASVVAYMCAGFVSAALAGAALAGAPAASAAGLPTTPASGSFVFKTANGILSTWNSEDLRLTGVSPGSAVTNVISATVTLPIVAKSGSANFAAGGFRITNTATGSFVNCATPAIDTRARVIDCVLRDGTNLPLFAMESIESRSFALIGDTTGAQYLGVRLRIAGQRAADFLNDELDTNTFSPYITIATGDLSVDYPR